MRTPRPNDPKMLKSWAQKMWPTDAVRQGREVQAGMKAIQQMQMSQQKHKAEMARRATNVRKARKK